MSDSAGRAATQPGRNATILTPVVAGQRRRPAPRQTGRRRYERDLS
ncbi:hypothetical protein QMK19_18470 [Streptomyces sp. H10-C2]|nr:MULTISPECIES: hypothetical protein [unclassified Streptomyces]MDJ0346125.1 hypothetical protein [Streptomyces sp. PH10-H1]MDJ0371613.1 hypothetical protein [Streptomyces sp. H10-C2]